MKMTIVNGKAVWSEDDGSPLKGVVSPAPSMGPGMNPVISGADYSQDGGRVNPMLNALMNPGADPLVDGMASRRAGNALMDENLDLRTGGGVHIVPMDTVGAGPTLQTMRRTMPEAMVNPQGLPVVEGVTMQRGDRGSGVLGENLDLRPISRNRFVPMSREEGIASGIISPESPMSMPSYSEPSGIVAAVRQLRQNRDLAMRTTAGDAMEKALDDTRQLRWGQSGPTSAVNRNVQAARNQQASLDAAGQMAQIRANEAKNTPQATAGGAGNSTWDPVSGEWKTEMAERGPSQKVATRLEAMDDNAILEGLSKYGKPKPMTADDLRKSDLAKWTEFANEKDDAKKKQYLETPWTEDNQRVYAQYARAAQQRGLIGSGDASWKKAFKKGG